MPLKKALSGMVPPQVKTAQDSETRVGDPQMDRKLFCRSLVSDKTI
jgi:hypothetical protein